MMNKLWKKVLTASVAGALILGLSACGGSDGKDGGDGHLVFMIWDSGQKSGMEAIAEAYMEDPPDVTIEVQASDGMSTGQSWKLQRKVIHCLISSGCTRIRCIHMRMREFLQTARIS